MSFIGIDLQGNKRIAEMISKLPIEVQDTAIDDVSDYVLRVLRIYPPRKSVSRKQAYGRTFESDKQRRYFFMALRKGIIKVPYQRTQTLGKGWKQIGSGKTSIIVNETPYAGFVMGEHGQRSRMHNIIGWDRIDAIPDFKREKIEKILFNSANKALKKLGFR